MIVISLDEYGEFEDRAARPVFIAGVLYDDEGDPTDLKEEEKRIKQYYTKAIKFAKNAYNNEKRGTAQQEVLSLFEYPQALHLNNSLGANQKTVVERVKKCVNNTLGEFIGSGTFNGGPLGNNTKTRKGRYHLFVILKGSNGMRALGTGSDKLINDEYGSNLYFHMAGRVVNRLVFHNPLYTREMPELVLKIATRSSKDCNQMTPDQVQQYQDLSYEAIGTSRQGGGFYSLMNSDVYRTLIAEEMLRCPDRGIKISDFSVHPIKYEAGKENPFAYLSDSLCTFLHFKTPRRDGTDIKKMNDLTNSLNPQNDNLVFVYDEVDNYFGMAIESFERCDLYGTLSSMYDIYGLESDYAKFYRERLFGLLKKQILEGTTMDMLDDAAEKVSKTIYSNSLSQERLKYIFEGMKDVALNGECRNERDRDKGKKLFKLWDAGIAASSHIGDSSGAIDCYNECIKYFREVGIDAVVRLNNKLVVAMEDLFSLDLAEEQARKNIGLQEKVETLLDGVLGSTTPSGRTARGKALSQYSRVLAAKRDEKAEENFREALACFEKGSPDYKITQSYLCQFLVDMAYNLNDSKYLDLFETEATDYFGGKKDYGARLRFIKGLIKKKDYIINSNYAFFILIRGLFVSCRMGRTSITDALWKELKESRFKATNETSKDEIATIGHPWEIIYKYLRMLAKLQNDSDYEKYCEEQQSNCIKFKGRTIEALVKFGDVQLKKEFGDNLAWKTASKELVDYLKKNFAAFKIKREKFPRDEEKLYRKLSGIFSFMYQ